MRRWLVTVAVLGYGIVPLRADIGITQSRTVEGRAAVLTPDAGLPRVTMRIKGMKARTDVETYGHTVTAITDVETPQVMMLLRLISLNSRQGTRSRRGSAAGYEPFTSNRASSRRRAIELTRECAAPASQAAWPCESTRRNHADT